MSNRKRVMISYFELMAEKDSINTVLLDKKDKADILIRAIQNYIDDYKLSGQAYSVSKTYFENIHLPMLEIFKECCDSLYKSNWQIRDDYSKHVGWIDKNTKYTDTDYHEDEIAKCNEQIATLKSERDSIQYQYYTNPLDGTVAVSSASIDAINAQINALENSIDLSNRWINKLHTFNDTATSSYEENCLAISAVKINQFKLLTTHLTESLKDRSTKNLFDASHWAIDEKILREEIDTKINNWILTSDNGIDWEKASDIYFHGSACSKDILAKLIIDKYGIDESQQDEWSLDSLLLYVAVSDPDVINIYFSNMTEVDRSRQIVGIINYQFDFEKIGDALQGNVDSVSMLEKSMLIAAFVTMDDNEREKFIGLAYSLEVTELSSMDPMSNDRSDYVVEANIGSVFSELTDRYGEIILTDDNYKILLKGNGDISTVGSMYNNVKEKFQIYNIMNGASNIDYFSKEITIGNWQYSESSSELTDIFSVEIDISDTSGSYVDPLDKQMKFYISSADFNIKYEVGDETILAYRYRPIDVLDKMTSNMKVSAEDEITSIVFNKVFNKTCPVPYVTDLYGYATSLEEVKDIVRGKDSMSVTINNTSMMNYYDFYGVEGSAIIDNNNNRIIYTASQINSEEFLQNLKNLPSTKDKNNDPIMEILLSECANMNPEEQITFIMENEEIKSIINERIFAYYFCLSN